MTKIIALGALLFVTGIVCLSNMSNEKVDGGYAAYVYSNPVWGCKEFKQVINGPGGTGMVWRQDSIVVCVTPYTMMESFDDIRAADQLKMNAEAHLVWRIDPTKIREFVEQYGAISEVEHTPEAIATDAYNSFVKQPFRTAVRTSIAEYRGLDAPANIPAITTKVENILREHFEGTPFIIESVTIGHTIPPESVTAGITRKVEASQEYERQAIQLEIARRNEEIQLAEGRAQANRVREEAQGALDKAKAEADAELYRKQQEAAAILAMRTAEAEGMKLEAEGRRALNDAIGENLIRYEAIRRVGDAKVPHINVGSDAIQPLMNMLNRAFGGGAQPTPTPAN
jgi:regulator of protease activity HflC (stomatin/prohibitin superfamily)